MIIKILRKQIYWLLEKNPFGAEAPPGFVWHHDTGGVMRLLPEDIHNSVKHTGSAAQHQTRKRKRKVKC